MLKQFMKIFYVAFVANVQLTKGDNSPLRATRERRQLFVNTPHMGGPINARSYELYSTIPFGEQLKTLGGKFVISKNDMFDYLPPAGEGYAKLLSELIERKSLQEEEIETWAEAHALSPDYDYFEKNVIPKPEQSLVEKELTVIATEEILSPSVGSILCHSAEVDNWFCHESHEPVDITKVTVTTIDSDTPSVVWAVCHDEDQYWCHIMNVYDTIFIPKKNGNAPTGLGSRCDDYAAELTSELKEYSKPDSFKKACEDVDLDSQILALEDIVLNGDDVCAKEVSMLVLEQLPKIKPVFTDPALCVPELTKQYMMVESFLDATVCGDECIEKGAALIFGLTLRGNILADE